MASATITGLYIYPVKSAQGLSVSKAEALAAGLAGDRYWMIVDSTGRFVSQRQKSDLATIAAIQTATGVTLACQGRQLHLNRGEITANAVLRDVTIWDDTVQAYDCGDAAAAFLAGTVGMNRGRPLSLVLVREHRSGTAFADGYPFLVTTEESLRDLRERIGRHHPGDETAITSGRFRPNIVLSGLPPFAEDAVAFIEAKNGVRLQLLKPCARCVITMTDPITGVRGPEPLRTLRTYRRHDSGILFGQNAVLAAGAGLVLAVGDAVKVTTKTS